MWQQWQLEMLLEADRLKLPMWAIAAEFCITVDDVYSKLIELWRTAA